MNVTYARRKAQRLCPWCTVPVEEPGRTYCPACREMLNELEQERKRRLRVAQRHPATPRARSTRGHTSPPSPQRLAETAIFLPPLPIEPVYGPENPHPAIRWWWDIKTHQPIVEE